MPWLAGLLAVFLTVEAAQAHAVLVESRPEDGASLASAPAELLLRFNEPVSLLAVRLLDGAGEEVTGIEVEARGETILVRPPSALPWGGYYLSYRVASSDAHAVGAALRFGIGVLAPGSVAGEPASSATWVTAGARWLVYLTALGSAGLVLFVALVPLPTPLAARAERLAAGLALAGLAALALRLGALGLELAGLPPGALLSAVPWGTAMRTTAGPASAAAAVGLLLIAGRRRLPAWSVIVGAVAVGASFGLTGHAASAEPRWLTVPALGFHVLAAAFWLGSFLPLRWSLDLAPQTAALVLRRFSAVATAVVAGLILAGVALAWVQLDGEVGASWRTAYGWRLLAKLALVAGLLALAALNRYLLTPGVAEGRRRTRHALRFSLAADLALGLGVLAVTATFPFSPPPRALASLESQAGSAASDGLVVVASAPEAQATLTLLPGRPGANRLQAWITDPGGVPLTAREAEVAWSLPTGGIERVRVAATLPAPGVAVADGVVLPRAGRWSLRLDLLIDDFTKLTFEAEIDVR